MFARERQLTEPYVRLNVPPVFSLQSNPVGVIKYVNAIRALYSAKKNVRQIFEHVVEIDTAALALAAATVNFHQGGCLTQCNLPVHDACRAVVIGSGMLDFTDYHYEDGHQKAGMMVLKSQSYRVEVKTAQKLIRHATEKAFGVRQRIPAAYRGLIEGMQNTFSHADKKEEGVRQWFAHVHADPNERKAAFTLIDNGVGIFKSVNLTPLKEILRTLGLVDNAEILQGLLERRILSSTGLRYRGRGLPSFQDAANSGTLSKVTIVSNDVYANLSAHKFATMTTEFHGTLLHWEISEKKI